MPQVIDHEPLLNALQNKMDVLLASSDSIDNRALGLLGANVAILIFIGQSDFVLDWWQWGILLTPFVIAIAYAVACLKPRKLISGVADSTRTYEALTKDKLVLQLLVDIKGALEFDTQIVTKRDKYLSLTFLWSAVAVLALLIVLAVE